VHGEPYTAIGDGRRAAWATGAFGQDVRTLEGVRARVIALAALREEKTGSRDDPAAEAKDREDRATLERIDWATRLKATTSTAPAVRRCSGSTDGRRAITPGRPHRSTRT